MKKIIMVALLSALLPGSFALAQGATVSVPVTPVVKTENTKSAPSIIKTEAKEVRSTKIKTATSTVKSSEKSNKISNTNTNTKAKSEIKKEVRKNTNVKSTPVSKKSVNTSSTKKTEVAKPTSASR